VVAAYVPSYTGASSGSWLGGRGRMGGGETSQKEWLRDSEYEAFGYARVLPLANALRGP